MGYWSDIEIEMQEEENNKKFLADILGITNDEILELVYEINVDKSKDDLVYSYRVEFDVENSNKNILNKIERLKDGCRVYLQPSELENDSDDEPCE